MRDESNFLGAATRSLLSDPPDLLFYLPNDHGNAERLIAMYGKDMKYCHAMKKWLVWDGRRWHVDETDQARRLAKQAMLEFLHQAITKAASEKVEKFARSCLEAQRISSMLSMAECEIYVVPSELDTHPYSLNFLNGTVDREGIISAHTNRGTLYSGIALAPPNTSEGETW